MNPINSEFYKYYKGKRNYTFDYIIVEYDSLLLAIFYYERLFKFYN